MPHNPGGAELSGLLCRSHSRALAAGHPRRCGWLRCEATLLFPPCPAPSEQQHAVVFHTGQLGPSCAACGLGVPCAVEGAIPGGCASPGCCGMASSPQSRGVWAAHALGALASGQPGEMLSAASQEPPQGLCLCSACACQLCFASPRPRFSLACSEPILEKEQESLAGWVLCNVKPKCECGEGRAQLMSSIHGACTAVCRAKTLLRHCRLFLSIIYSAYLALSSP